METKTGTRRIIWICKCGIVERHTYQAARSLLGVDKWGAKKWSEPSVTRVHADGVARHVSADATCRCGRNRAGNTVQGRVTSHECDAKCMASKGGVCECACGGRNHGSSYAAA